MAGSCPLSHVQRRPRARECPEACLALAPLPRAARVLTLSRAARLCLSQIGNRAEQIKKEFDPTLIVAIGGGGFLSVSLNEHGLD